MLRFRAFCKRYAGWILITLVLLLCQRWWMARNKPERLLELPKDYVFTRLQNGFLTLQENERLSSKKSITYIRRPGSSRLIPVEMDNKPPAQFTMPVTGGPLRPVFPDSIEAASSEDLFRSGADTYRAEYRKTSGLVGIPPGYGNTYGTAFISGPTGGVGSAAPPPQPKPPFHTVTYREEADGVTALLRCVSGSGAPSSETVTCPMGYIAKSHIRQSGSPIFPPKSFPSGSQSIVFSGNAVYWIKGFPTESTYQESSNGQVVGDFVYKYRSAVMTMPLRGGTPRKLLDNVPEDTRLLASEDGVLCRINRITKNNTVEWQCVRPDGSPQQSLTNASPSEDNKPVESNHHLYWTQSDERSYGVKIMQAETDGSSPRVLYTASHSFRVVLQPWRGRVYFRVQDPSIQNQSEPIYKSSLYRINPAPPSGVERLCALPDDTREVLFDGDYAYCLVDEKKTGLMNTFRTESLPEVREVLYRYRLPSP